MEDFVRFAIAKGVKKYGFSSHAPLPFRTFWNMDLENLPDYKEEFYRLKEKYADQIKLFIGLEVDYIEGVFDARSDLYDMQDFDYLISSVHFLAPHPDGGYFSVDGPFDAFQKNMKEFSVAISEWLQNIFMKSVPTWFVKAVLRFRTFG